MLFETMRLQPTRHPSSKSCAAISEGLAVGQKLLFSRFTRRATIQLVNPWMKLNQQLPWVQLLSNLAPTLTNLYSLE